MQKIKFYIKSYIFQNMFLEKLLSKEYLSKRPFLVNFISLNISSGINKILNFILFIFLIRFLTVADYGIYTLVWAHISLLSPLLDLGTTSYSLINLSSKKLQEFKFLLSLRLILSVVVFLLTIFLGIVIGYKIDIIIYIVLTSVVIISNMWSGSYLILTSVKEKNYLSSLLSIYFNFFLIISLISFLVILKKISVVFIVIFIFYNIYTIANIIAIKKELKILRLSFNYKKWFNIMKNSYIFVLIAFFGGLYFKLDILLLKLLKSETEVGIYSAGYKFFEALIFIASSYSITAVPVLSRILDSGIEQFFIKVKKDVTYLGIIGISISFTLYFISPIILQFLLHKDYLFSLEVLRIVIFSLPFILISSVFMNMLYILKKAYIVILLFIFQTVFNLILNLIYIPKFSFLASSYITLFGEALNMLILMLIFRYIRNRMKYSTLI